VFPQIIQELQIDSETVFFSILHFRSILLFNAKPIVLQDQVFLFQQQVLLPQSCILIEKFFFLCDQTILYPVPVQHKLGYFPQIHTDKIYP
jgi:hypothetical protein